MSKNLKDLADNRNDIIWAEVAILLHNWRKCTDRHIIKHARGEKKDVPEANELVIPALEINLLGQPITIQRLLDDDKQNKEYNGEEENHWLRQALAACHSAAHTEKEEVFFLFEQVVNNTYKNTPFGYKSEKLAGLDIWLDTLSKFIAPFNGLDPICFDIEKEIKHAFSHACGDTRLPLNDVTLWDWSRMAAALYKAALAEAVLYDQPNPTPTKWRLFSIRLDGLGFLVRASRLPDLLARQMLIEDSLNKVRWLLEEKYPLGTEVYRDENGSVFIVPNLDNIRELENENGVRLESLVQESFSKGTLRDDISLQLHGEILPTLEVDEKGWQWENPNQTHRSSQQIVDRHNKPLPIAAHVQEGKLLPIHADSSIVSNWWRNHRGDICTVCQLRPQDWSVYGYDRKALERKVCAVCERRREENSEKWSGKLSTTVWIDEVADINGRVALVVGKFGLETWFNGDSLFYPQVRQDDKKPIHGALRVKNLGGQLSDGERVRIKGKEYKVVACPGRVMW